MNIIINPYIFKNVPATTLLNGLMACWELDETSGTIAYDAEGEHNADINNLTIGQTGIINNCYNFNNGYVYMGNANDFSFNPLEDNYSISMWIKSNIPYHSHTARMVDTYSQQGRSYPFNFYQLANTGEVWLNMYNGTKLAHAVVPGNLVWDGDWHHLIMVVVDLQIKAYLDGDLIDTVDIDFSTFAGLIWKFTIGAESLVLGTKPFVGSIDQTAIWNRALMQQEISDLYNNGNGRAYSEF